MKCLSYIKVGSLKLSSSWIPKNGSYPFAILFIVINITDILLKLILENVTDLQDSNEYWKF